ncbi:hypothetical protein TNIN_244841 [Trichonephila inaurata madagascariensis]|uniref:Uncharacterized protein n=1 Tax=Trichonephila inaurata madagascariensis TaxID=2747483 RepID=A0A8X7CGB8_9ARAC|nr:hypothetical protein TNIN_244841 [Trichonephila inaurata madagascariensis]
MKEDRYIFLPQVEPFSSPASVVFSGTLRIVAKECHRKKRSPTKRGQKRQSSPSGRRGRSAILPGVHGGRAKVSGGL